MERRDAIKLLAGGAAVAAASVAVAKASESGGHEGPAASPDALGMLYDTTLCIGCKACVSACSTDNELPVDTGASNGLHQAPGHLNARTKNIIKVYKDTQGPGYSYVKRQCMQCIDPACAAACMMHALKKDPVTGVVSWHGESCVGCRYCQIGCPFNVPAFEWVNFNPKIVKCELCQHLYAKGGGPACCRVCPRKAVIFGKRTELLEIARQRIADNPGRYWKDHIYGEKEVGGTQVLYLSHVPFDSIDLPQYYDKSIPVEVHKVQGKIYYGFIAPVIAYAACVTMILKNQKKDEAQHGHGEGRP